MYSDLILETERYVWLRADKDLMPEVNIDLNNCWLIRIQLCWFYSHSILEGDRYGWLKFILIWPIDGSKPNPICWSVGTTYISEYFYFFKREIGKNY